MMITVTPYERKYREPILNLLYYSRRVHSHLDWYRVGQWLDLTDKQVLLAHRESELVGFMGVSEVLNQTAWLRLVALQNHADPAQVLPMLWRQAQQQLQGVQQATVLVVNRWLLRYLPAMGFEPYEEVVTLQRNGTRLPDAPPTPVSIRQGYGEDLHPIEAIDHAAFNPPWQMSHKDLRQAQRQSAICTLAELDGQTIGYQISTRHQSNGHLARIGVLPKQQGKRIGGALVHHLIENFLRRGVRTITVNTQASNTASQRLYQRYGFYRNGYDLPIWHTTEFDL